jgi:hypothetical protein
MGSLGFCTRGRNGRAEAAGTICKHGYCVAMLTATGWVALVLVCRWIKDDVPQLEYSAGQILEDRTLRMLPQPRLERLEGVCGFKAA